MKFLALNSSDPACTNLKMLSINMTVCDLNCLSLDNDTEIGSKITIPAKIVGFVPQERGFQHALGVPVFSSDSFPCCREMRV